MTETEQQEIAALARACKGRDAIAQQRVFKKYYGLMLAVCIRYAPNREEARDMLQDGFVKIFEKIDQYDESYSFVAWMKRIMINTAIDQYRKNMRTPTSDDETVLLNESVDEDAIASLGYQEILKLIQLLPKGYRTVFNLYVIEGYSHKEIADKLGVAEGTSKSQLNKAKKILQKKITELNADNERIRK